MLVRRLVVAPLAFVLELAFVVVSPLLAVVAALLVPVVGTRALRLLAIAVGCAVRHAAGLLACLGLWVASGFGARSRSPRFQRAYYDLLRWFVGGVYRSIARWARVEVRIDGSEEALAALSRAGEPAIVLSRHAGEGDSLLVLHQLLCRHGRRPRLVLHEALRLDPLIDVLGHRLPNRFVDPRGGDTEVEIAAMTEDVGRRRRRADLPRGRQLHPGAPAAGHRAPPGGRARAAGRLGGRDAPRPAAATGRDAGLDAGRSARAGVRHRARRGAGRASARCGSGCPPARRSSCACGSPRTPRTTTWSGSTGCSACGGRSTTGSRRATHTPGERRTLLGMDLEERTLEDTLERSCAVCGAQLTTQEILESRESGGPVPVLRARRRGAAGRGPGSSTTTWTRA